MKLNYLIDLFGHVPHYKCDEFSCSVYNDVDEVLNDANTPLSKYNVPFDFVEIDKGSIVVNIVSNLGYEIMKASEKTGTQGKVIGVDFSSTMMYRARYNVEKTGCKNVSFREVISSKFLPLGGNISDALIFNRRLNRFPNDNLFSEIHRTLKPGGAFYIYDIISDCIDRMKPDIFSKSDYIRKLQEYRFKNIEIMEISENILPEELIAAEKKGLDVDKLTPVLIRGEK